MSIIQTFDSVFWHEIRVLNGAPLKTFTSSGQPFRGYSTQEPAALGDSTEYVLDVEPGDYTFTMYGFRDALSGIKEIFFDGVSAAIIDMYNPTTDFDTVNSFAVTVLNQSPVIRTDVIGKNALSNDYYISMTRVTLLQV